MNKGEKVKVYFKMNGRCHGLFNIVQMGKDGIVDLKITDYYIHAVIKPKNSIEEKGYLTRDEWNTSRFIQKSEMSYHKDGSCLHKILDSSEPEHSNPYGQGERWTATNAIEDFQPIMSIAIRRMDIYNRSTLQPRLKSKETAYICENDDLFKQEGTYLVILYIRNKKLPINCYTSVDLYSDIIAELNKELDLCIIIQRQHYPAPQPYYSEQYKGMLTPYLVNSCSFCNKESSKNEMKDKLNNNIFNSKLHHFLSAMTDGKFINLSEDKLQLIDQVDILYKGHEGRMPIEKPVFIKQALKFLGHNLFAFNRLTPTIKQNLLKQWNEEVKIEIQKSK